METEHALRAFMALSSRARLDVLRLLVRHAPDGLVVSEILARIALSPSQLSFHLKALMQAGLLVVQAEGRFLRYRADLPRLRALSDFLTSECCAGQPEQCGLAAEPSCDASDPSIQP